jgi:hypothetical protein
VGANDDTALAELGITPEMIERGNDYLMRFDRLQFMPSTYLVEQLIRAMFGLPVAD